MKKNGRERGFLTLVDMDAERVISLPQAVKSFVVVMPFSSRRGKRGTGKWI
jgi:hypothetical protein